MKPHAQLRTTVACKYKRRFSDEAHARAKGSVTAAEMGEAQLWVYPCKQCSGWHLTSRDRGVRWRVDADHTVIARG